MRNPTTWEEATQDVAVQMPSWRDGEGLSLDEVLVDIEETLDDLRGGDHEKNEYATFRYLAWLGAVGYVHEKWDGAEKKVPDRVGVDFVRRCDDVVRSVLVLLPKKQHDYGPDNIIWGGVQGVVIRAHDKLARIKNLRARQSTQVASALGVTAYNEPLADSYFDLIGYGIVGAMLVKGTFQLPLEADLPKPGPAWVFASDDPGFQERAAADRARFEAEKPIDDGDHPLFFDEEVEIIRHIVRDEMAKREQAKSHG